MNLLNLLRSNKLGLFNGKPKTFDVSSIKYRKPIDEQLISKLISYLQSYYQNLSKRAHHSIMLGIDGEINSWVAAKLLKQALGENVWATVFNFNNPTWTSSAVKFCEQLGLENFVFDVDTEYQDEVSAYQLHKPIDLRLFYKRFINYHLLTLADLWKVNLADTADKSDRLLGVRPEGFYGHFIPFYSLYKSELYELAYYLGIPNQFIYQTEFQDIPYPDNIPLTWDKIDPVLYLLTEKQLKVEDVSQQYNIDIHWLRRLRNHINKQLFQTTVSQFII